MISQPGVADPEPPFVISSGTDPESASPQLTQTARGIAAAAFGERDPAPGGWVGLSRLAYPVGLGEQAALRRAGVEAIAISAAGSARCRLRGRPGPDLDRDPGRDRHDGARSGH